MVTGQTAGTSPQDPLLLIIQSGSQGQWCPGPVALHFLTPTFSVSGYILKNCSHATKCTTLSNCFYNSKAYVTVIKNF